MLKSRVITALVLFPLALSAIFFLSNANFALVIGIVMLIAAYEWAGFAGFPTIMTKMAFVVITATVIYSIWLMNFLIPNHVMNYSAAVFWLISSVLVFKYPQSAVFWKDRSLLIAIMGIFLLLFTWYALISIHAVKDLQMSVMTIDGTVLLLFCMMLIWSADTGAYFSGKRFGRRKLARAVSPGKSWEGVYGGLLLAIIMTTLFALYFSVTWVGFFKMLMICIVTVIFSIIGDLMESMFKRQAGIKDSGKILPGHGGILDRIDGITAAAPVFFIILSQMYQF